MKIIKKAFKKLLSPFMSKMVIIRSDGGICSQIAFHALGLSFEKMGYIVKYDLSWFQECGKDMTGQFDRSFAMHKTFPKMNIIKASDREIKVFKKLYHFPYDMKTPPKFLYIDGYPERMTHLIQNKDTLLSFFNPLGKKSIEYTLEKIQNCPSCAVHVRRGDLSVYNPAYGAPASIDYFIKAIQTVQTYFSKKLTFFFFSDEMEWVKKNLIPLLPPKTKYFCCGQNDSSQGYLDLYLMTYANAIISSQGSMGIFGRILSRQLSPPLVLSKRQPEVEKSFPNCIFIGDERTKTK